MCTCVYMSMNVVVRERMEDVIKCKKEVHVNANSCNI